MIEAKEPTQEEIKEIKQGLKEISEGKVIPLNVVEAQDHYEEYMWGKATPGHLEKQEPKCPYLRRRQAGDETYDICELKHKPCLIEHGLYACETYEEIKKEEESNERTNTD